MHPRRLEAGTEVRSVGEELLIFHAREGRLHQLNAAAAAIWSLCDGEHSLEQIAEALQARFDAPGEQMACDLAATLAELRRLGLLAPPD